MLEPVVSWLKSLFSRPDEITVAAEQLNYANKLISYQEAEIDRLRQDVIHYRNIVEGRFLVPEMNMGPDPRLDTRLAQRLVSPSSARAEFLRRHHDKMAKLKNQEAAEGDVIVSGVTRDAG